MNLPFQLDNPRILRPDRLYPFDDHEKRLAAKTEIQSVIFASAPKFFGTWDRIEIGKKSYYVNRSSFQEAYHVPPCISATQAMRALNFVKRIFKIDKMTQEIAISFFEHAPLSVLRSCSQHCDKEIAKACTFNGDGKFIKRVTCLEERVFIHHSNKIGAGGNKVIKGGISVSQKEGQFRFGDFVRARLDPEDVKSIELTRDANGNTREGFVETYGPVDAISKRGKKKPKQYIYMKRYPQDLEKRSRTPISNEEFISWSKSLLKALIHLHKQGFFFSDIKPNNILIDRENAVFCDLDSMCEMGKGIKRGASYYRPLELENKIFRDPRINAFINKGGTEKSDIFSLGVTFIEIWDLYHFEQQASTDLFNHGGLATERYVKLKKDLNRQFPQFAQLLLSMIATDPKERPTAGQVLEELEKEE